MTTPVSRTVLITGCSSGIGRATARHLATRGWKVYATARKVDGLDDLRQAGCQLLPLDVTSETSMQEAIAEVEKSGEVIGVLINNAGYSQSGAFESVPVEQVRRQFETNVFGLVRMTQLVLPGMRAQGWGKIVNIGSMGGKLTFPGGGYYHATKYALEALSDALRFEVGGFGIDTILIEPGIIKTNFADTASGSVDKAVSSNDVTDDAYSTFNARVMKATREVYEKGPLARLGGTPETVAHTIERALNARRPRARYTVTPSASLIIGVRRLLTDRLWDGFLRSQYPQPK